MGIMASAMRHPRDRDNLRKLIHNMRHPRDRDNLRKLIRQLGFKELEDFLMQHARPSIRLYTTPVESEAQIPVGQSKIGGRPDLPRDMDWVTVPNHQGKPISLPFIAQFDLAKVKPYDEEDWLPSHGILYFFADYWSATDFKDRGRVIFFDGDPDVLERKPFPDDIPPTPDDEWGERYAPCTVEFVPEVNLPFEDADWKMPVNYPEGKTWEDFYELIYSASYTRPRHLYRHEVNRFLGYNYDVPDDMQMDCQFIANGIYPYNVPSETRDLYEPTKGDWQLLFQMDSDINAGMMWSDAGVICFYIRRDDLKNRMFDRACLTAFSS